MTKAEFLSPGLKKVIARAQIIDVRLVAVSAKSSIRSLDEIDSVKEIEHSQTVSQPELKDGVLLVQVRCEVKAGTPDTPDPFLRIGASFEVEYTLPKELEPSEEDLRGFAETNGVFNVWSFWRELVQSITTRMGFPALTVPLYRLSLSELGQTGELTKPPERIEANTRP